MPGMFDKISGFLAGRADIDGALDAIRESVLHKGWRTELPVGPPVHPLRSLFYDPFQLVAAMGYKDRKYSLSYDVLRRIAKQLTVVAAIHARRINQVAALSAPFRITKSLGYEIRHRDPEHQTTRSEKLFIKELEQFVSRCGKPDAIRQISPTGQWDDFETFLRKVVRDSLTYDQLTFEIVPDQAGRPCAFTAVDAATIRIAVTDDDLRAGALGPASLGSLATVREALSNFDPGPYGRPRVPAPPPERIQYVQLFQGQIVNLYSTDELAFCIRNPRTDIFANGYGFSELEQLVLVVTSILWAEEYNRNFFKNGSLPKGIINFKTDTPDPENFEQFRAYWNAQMSGVQNAWRTPLFQSEGMEYINLQANNRDMEFTQWVEYLLRLATALHGMDPSEINFDITRAGSAQPLFESPSEARVADSKENGLRPLLRFIARAINRHVIERIDDNFYFDFIGLDELSEAEKMQIRSQEISTYKTIDEVRAEADLPALPDGSGQIILNPVWAQFKQLELQQAQMAQQQQAQSQAPTADAPAAAQAPVPQPSSPPLPKAL